MVRFHQPSTHMHPIDTKNDHLENVSILSNMAILGMLKSQGVFFNKMRVGIVFPPKKLLKNGHLSRGTIVILLAILGKKTHGNHDT